jgi:hypothetical protein
VVDTKQIAALCGLQLGKSLRLCESGRPYAKHESIIVWTSLIGQAFLDAYESLGEERYLDVAKSICNWIVKLPREEAATGTCLSYLAIRQSSIHNANMLGAAMLARTAKAQPDGGTLRCGQSRRGVQLFPPIARRRLVLR